MNIRYFEQITLHENWFYRWLKSITEYRAKIRVNRVSARDKENSDLRYQNHVLLSYNDINKKRKIESFRNNTNKLVTIIKQKNYKNFANEEYESLIKRVMSSFTRYSINPLENYNASNWYRYSVEIDKRDACIKLVALFGVMMYDFDRFLNDRESIFNCSDWIKYKITRRFYKEAYEIKHGQKFNFISDKSIFGILFEEKKLFEIMEEIVLPILENENINFSNPIPPKYKEYLDTYKVGEKDREIIKILILCINEYLPQIKKTKTEVKKDQMLENSIKKIGAGWEINFNGKRKILKDLLGIYYFSICLHAPNRFFPYSLLVREHVIEGLPIKEEYYDLNRIRVEIKAEIKGWKDTNDEDPTAKEVYIERLEKELKNVNNKIKKINLSSKDTTLTSKKTSDSFTKACRNARSRCEKEFPEFYEHINNHIKWRNGNISYTGDLDWG